MLTATRRQRRALQAVNRKQQSALRLVPEAEWPQGSVRPPKIKEIWRSQEYLVQVFQEENDIERLSVCRTSVCNGDWVDGIAWDDLQRLKRECGRGNKDAVEIFPADTDVVNVANMRHLWVLPSVCQFKWTLS